jgi:Ca2+-binding RTX toxin-like protein
MALQIPEDRLIILENETNYSLTDDPNYINVWGNAQNNRITGNSLGNSLDGDGGADTLVGGAGNDTYWIDQPNDFPGMAGDTVIERAGEGIDTVNSYVGYALGANVENLVLFDNSGIPITHVISGTGNNLNNYITGNRHDNDLHGRAGNDILNGGLGHDALHGGAGRDRLTGGLGRDLFVFDTKPNKAANQDRITDYSVKDDSQSGWTTPSSRSSDGARKPVRGRSASPISRLATGPRTRTTTSSTTARRACCPTMRTVQEEARRSRLLNSPRTSR